MMNRVRQFFAQPTLYFGLGNVALGFGIGLNAGSLTSIPVLTSLVIGLYAFLNCYGALGIKSGGRKFYRFLKRNSCISHYLCAVSICFAINCTANLLQCLQAAGHIILDNAAMNLIGGNLSGRFALALMTFNAAMFFGHLLFAAQVKQAKKKPQARTTMPQIVMPDLSYAIRPLAEALGLLANDAGHTESYRAPQLLPWMIVKTSMIQNTAVVTQNRTVI